MIIETFRQAIQNVWSNKLRTFLTMLGIIIGVMAVIVIVGLGNGMTKSMRDSFSAMGTNTLSVSIWGYGSRTASVDDVYDIVKKNPDLLESISPADRFQQQHAQGGHHHLPLHQPVRRGRRLYRDEKLHPGQGPQPAVHGHER